MKAQLKKMKSELKALAKEIKFQKSIRKLSHPKHELFKGYRDESFLFRHKHVAYCLSRGRTLEQVDSGNKLDMELVKWYQNAMNPESKEKLYVVVDGKLSPSQQAVQAGHAVAAFLKKYPDTLWSNGYLVYLKEEDKYQFTDVGLRMQWSTIATTNQYARFHEPDLGNKVTAYAVFGPNTERAFRNYKLV